MKVLSFDTESRLARVQLTRRNLLSLLAKLNFNQGAVPLESRSACTISKSDEAGTIVVQAVEDDEHYSDRDPGSMLDNESGDLY